MDDMGTPGPNHPAHRGLKPDKDNVAQLPGMNMRRLRVFKNSIMDHVFGPEKVSYTKDWEQPEREDYEDYGPFVEEGKSPLAQHIKDSIAGSGDIQGSLNEMFGRNNNDFHEAKIISLGKFKEDRDNKRLMGESND
jgi:hypothetical protein